MGETIQCNNAWISNIVQYNLYVHTFFGGWRGGVGCVLHLHSPLGDFIHFLYSTLTISAESTA